MDSLDSKQLSYSEIVNYISNLDDGVLEEIVDYGSNYSLGGNAGYDELANNLKACWNDIVDKNAELDANTKIKLLLIVHSLTRLHSHPRYQQFVQSISAGSFDEILILKFLKLRT